MKSVEAREKIKQIPLMSRADFPSAKQDCLPAHIGLPDTKMKCWKKRKRVDLAQKTALYHQGPTLQGLQLFEVICVGQSETFSYRTITGESTQNPKGCFDCARLLSINQALPNWKWSIPNSKFSFLAPNPASSIERPPCSSDSLPHVFSNWATLS